ncbi:MAG: hypothetical protein LBN10_09570, partial [Propionibacteriaceae bacterium]|nr:hypothetical protein [Propionibacteriaceae bacterium]
MATTLVAVLAAAGMCFGAVPTANADQIVTTTLHERILTPTGANETLDSKKVQPGGRISWDVNVVVTGPMLAPLTVTLPRGIDVPKLPQDCVWKAKDGNDHGLISCNLKTFDATVHFDAVVATSVAVGTTLRVTFTAANVSYSASVPSVLKVSSASSGQPTTPSATPSASTNPPVKPTAPATTVRPHYVPGTTVDQFGDNSGPLILTAPSGPGTSTSDPAVSLRMTGHVDSGASAKVGDLVVFDFQVLNSGGAPLGSFTLSTGFGASSGFVLGPCTSQSGASIILNTVVLSPNESFTCTGMSPVTQADLDVGQKVNSSTIVKASVVGADATVQATSSGAV